MAITFVTKSGGTVRAFDDAAARRGLTGETAVLTVGQQMKYEVISGNTLRVYDGVFMLQGRQVNINPNTYEDFVFDVGTQNQVRYDICGFEYKKTDTAESIEKFITKNVGASGKPTEKDLWNGAASTQGGLYRVKFNGVSIQSVEPLFTLAQTIPEMMEAITELGKSTMLWTRSGKNRVSFDWAQGTDGTMKFNIYVDNTLVRTL